MKVFKFTLIAVFVACSPVQKRQVDPALVDATAEEIIQKIDAQKGEKPVLINFWATWCIPCVEEFPYIMELKETYGEEFELIFVSGDFDDARPAAELFLKEHNVNFISYFKQGNDNEFIEAISDNWSGALPYTMVIDIEGNITAEWEGKAEYETFEKELLKVIKTES